MPVQAFIGLAVFVAALWLIAAVDLIATQVALFFFKAGFIDVAGWFIAFETSQYGILPRDADSLIGIPLHVFIHSDFRHLLSNSAPLLVLGGLIAFRGAGNLLGVSVFITLFAGAAVWLIGRSAMHIGASGLVFGYFGYLVAHGFFERRLLHKILSVVIAIVVFVLYGRMLMGVLPVDTFISWEGHLMGLIGGGVCAWLFSRYDEPEDPPSDVPSDPLNYLNDRPQPPP